VACGCDQSSHRNHLPSFLFVQVIFFFVGSSCAKGRRWRTAGRVSNQASTSRAQPPSGEARPLDSLLDADAAADIFISFFHFLWLLLLDYFIDLFNERIKSIRLPNPNVNEPTCVLGNLFATNLNWSFRTRHVNGIS
jgi:hypothetical protein